MALIVGWHSIVAALGSRPSRIDLTKVIGEWKLYGMPVWYVPELDDRPRIESSELMKWIKCRSRAGYKGSPTDKVNAVDIKKGL